MFFGWGTEVVFVQGFSNKAVEVSSMFAQGEGVLSDKGAECHVSSTGVVVVEN